MKTKRTNVSSRGTDLLTQMYLDSRKNSENTVTLMQSNRKSKHQQYVSPVSYPQYPLSTISPPQIAHNLSILPTLDMKLAFMDKVIEHRTNTNYYERRENPSACNLDKTGPQLAMHLRSPNILANAIGIQRLASPEQPPALRKLDSVAKSSSQPSRPTLDKLQKLFRVDDGKKEEKTRIVFGSKFSKINRAETTSSIRKQTSFAQQLAATQERGSAPQNALEALHIVEHVKSDLDGVRSPRSKKHGMSSPGTIRRSPSFNNFTKVSPTSRGTMIGKMSRKGSSHYALLGLDSVPMLPDTGLTMESTLQPVPLNTDSQILEKCRERAAEKKREMEDVRLAEEKRNKEELELKKAIKPQLFKRRLFDNTYKQIAKKELGQVITKVLLRDDDCNPWAKFYALMASPLKSPELSGIVTESIDIIDKAHRSINPLYVHGKVKKKVVKVEYPKKYYDGIRFEEGDYFENRVRRDSVESLDSQTEICLNENYTQMIVLKEKLKALQKVPESLNQHFREVRTALYDRIETLENQIGNINARRLSPPEYTDYTHPS